MDTIRWSKLQQGDWNLIIAATDKGLCWIGSEGRGLDELEQWAASRRPGAGLVRDDAALDAYRTQLGEYLDGNRTGFDLPADLGGTPFQQKVWQALREIPCGETVTYSDIAERIGRPSAVRAVAAAIGANPVLMLVPCHRVIGKNGKLTGFRGGLEMKERLLALEAGR
ncbi:methylated-DNA--[protein]-cysteine S-methyltransferase [Bhargavaea beijingensis]|uniref:Methylated-DNA--protein-cysteine methyltransferase n=1 Tax=Bhargavaea beijingensis TaxID=426756 RepID=A0A1G6Y2E9_9BACL|nr:methylated-DNA--[protein]-cysteine S-methyltransferase [Bhargavaea beijingensis]RSK25171.1 methylated-DNA--[protein]-cysteine S-methyltransferase [Bhargavaea beijingensis]SDD83785.1 methylated-DNA-[protein]-cysteine S-methyltransferase [Bhargavaea beijingensis]